ncbi:MAG: hypothetical protein KDB14_03460 [Planctomycetales bacterium]|nr:hypothetical protein [Planctomycetales bacterium]
MPWTEESLNGHLLDVFEPVDPSPHNYVVVYLHGVHLQRLLDKQAFLDEFERHGLRCVAPMTQRSWWTDRICEEFDKTCTAERHLLDRVLPFIETRWGVGPPRVALLGTSMGGQGALRLSYKYPDRFPVTAAIAPAIDYYLRMQRGGDETLPGMYRDSEQARQDSAILHIHPLNWPRHQFFCCDPTDSWWDSADRLKMKLDSLGIPSETDLETVAGGHGFGYYEAMAPQAVSFLAERLERERLRVL